MTTPSYLEIPSDFALRIRQVFGPAGEAWLESLPERVAEYARRWSLRVQPPFPLSYNYVAPAVRGDGSPAVLKLGVPNPELQSEMAALQAYDGRGIIQLLEIDAPEGAMLLERLLPGIPLSSLEDDRQAMRIAAGVMRQLWRPVPPDWGHLRIERWTAGLKRLRLRFNGGCGPFPPRLVDQAERLFAELLASTTQTVLLHGDLHHDNILSSQRQPWLALDPKGVAGDPAYEPAALLANPIPQIYSWPNLGAILRRRADQLADELSLDRQRILGWGIAQAVLSAWWDYEDLGSGWEPWLVIADHLAGLVFRQT